MRFTRQRRLTAAACAAVALTGGLALAGSKTIQVKGSDTMVNLGQAWAEAYMKRDPEASIAVTGGGSGTGIAALVNGTADLAQSSRSIKAKEKAMIEKKAGSVREFTVAIDALVVAVNPSNKVEKLTISQLSDIFTGKVTSWKDVGGADHPIHVLSRERNSGTHVFFLEHVVRKGNEKGPEEFARSVLMMPASQAIADEIARNANAIGYYGLGYLKETNKAVAVVKEAGGEPVMPTPDDARSGRYPLARGLFFYTPGEPRGEVKAFVDFCLSPDGQKIVEKLDFVPLARP